jgi:hypothetical protein
VIESRVDIQGDIDAINRGEGFSRDDTYTVNGRTYGVEANGRSNPIAGPGIHVLDRPAFKALGVYNVFGRSSRAEAILDAMGIAPEQRQQALTAWELVRAG